MCVSNSFDRYYRKRSFRVQSPFFQLLFYSLQTIASCSTVHTPVDAEFSSISYFFVPIGISPFSKCYICYTYCIYYIFFNYVLVKARPPTASHLGPRPVSNTLFYVLCVTIRRIPSNTFLLLMCAAPFLLSLASWGSGGSIFRVSSSLVLIQRPRAFIRC